jgi:hypothetical protein
MENTKHITTTESLKNLTWADVKAAETGHVFLDKFDEGVRLIIMRGPCNLCAYIGIPKEHPLAGFEYDDVPISCHGGLTYASEGGKQWPEGFYWYGWDYGHSGDATYYDEPPLRGMYSHNDDHKWTPGEVEEDSWTTIWEFQKLAKLAEKILERKSSPSPPRGWYFIPSNEFTSLT